MAAFKSVYDIPEEFPDNYSYRLSRGEIRVKEITDEESATRWLHAYETRSHTSWSVSRTYPTSGQRVIFKKEWKCHHNVQQRKTDGPKRASKNLNCPAVIRITVHRITRTFKKNEECVYPCTVLVNFNHNHLTNPEAAVGYRRMGEKTEEALIALFKKGHDAASALEAHRIEVYLEDPDGYFEKADNAYYVPSLSAVQYLYNKTFNGVYDARENEPIVDDIMLTSPIIEHEEIEIEETEEIPSPDSIIEVIPTSDDEPLFLTPEDVNGVQKIFNRILSCATSNPCIFVPAIRNMLDNYDKFCLTDDVLESALYNFGRYAGQAALSDCNIGINHCKKVVKEGKVDKQYSNNQSKEKRTESISITKFRKIAPKPVAAFDITQLLMEQ